MVRDMGAQKGTLWDCADGLGGTVMSRTTSSLSRTLKPPLRPVVGRSSSGAAGEIVLNVCCCDDDVGCICGWDDDAVLSGCNGMIAGAAITPLTVVTG